MDYSQELTELLKEDFLEALQIPEYLCPDFNLFVFNKKSSNMEGFIQFIKTYNNPNQEKTPDSIGNYNIAYYYEMQLDKLTELLDFFKVESNPVIVFLGAYIDGGSCSSNREAFFEWVSNYYEGRDYLHIIYYDGYEDKYYIQIDYPPISNKLKNKFLELGEPFIDEFVKTYEIVTDDTFGENFKKVRWHYYYNYITIELNYFIPFQEVKNLEEEDVNVTTRNYKSKILKKKIMNTYKNKYN